MNLISNISTIFASTIGNLKRIEERFQDINDSLLKAINSHISKPEGGRFIVATGFGAKWISSYSKEGLPTDALRSYPTWIDPLLSPILSDAISSQINACALLMLSATPATAQAASVLAASVLSLIPGGQPIAATMTTGIASAVSTGALNTIPALVSTALTGLAGIITSQRLVSSVADLCNRLDFDLEAVGLPGVVALRPTSWTSVNAQILLIPFDPTLAGVQGQDFWRAILLTIQQAIPGITSI